MLKILFYDNSESIGKFSLTTILNDAYVHRMLPINKLIKYNDLRNLSGDYNDRLSRFNLFIMFLKPESKECNNILDEIIKFKNIFVMFIVEKNVDLSIYITPNIRTSAIIYNPIDTHLFHMRLIDIYIKK